MLQRGSKVSRSISTRRTSHYSLVYVWIRRILAGTDRGWRVARRVMVVEGAYHPRGKPRITGRGGGGDGFRGGGWREKEKKRRRRKGQPGRKEIPRRRWSRMGTDRKLFRAFRGLSDSCAREFLSVLLLVLFRTSARARSSTLRNGEMRTEKG